MKVYVPVPVEERLPKFGEHVIVILESGKLREAFCFGAAGWKGTWLSIDEDEVTHWLKEVHIHEEVDLNMFTTYAENLKSAFQRGYSYAIKLLKGKV